MEELRLDGGGLFGFSRLRHPCDRTPPSAIVHVNSSPFARPSLACYLGPESRSSNGWRPKPIWALGRFLGLVQAKERQFLNSHKRREVKWTTKAGESRSPFPSEVHRRHRRRRLRGHGRAPVRAHPVRLPSLRERLCARRWLRVRARSTLYSPPPSLPTSCRIRLTNMRPRAPASCAGAVGRC